MEYQNRDTQQIIQILNITYTRFTKNKLAQPTYVTSTMAAASKLHFFDLPTEIRLEIYSLVLTAPMQPIILGTTASVASLDSRADNSTDSDSDGSSRRLELSVAVLRTCMRIYREATPVLYRRNILQFTGDADDICAPLGPCLSLRQRQLAMEPCDGGGWRYPRRELGTVVLVIGFPDEQKYRIRKLDGLLRNLKKLADSGGVVVTKLIVRFEAFWTDKDRAQMGARDVAWQIADSMKWVKGCDDVTVEGAPELGGKGCIWGEAARGWIRGAARWNT
jgi:hypothetical protein